MKAEKQEIVNTIKAMRESQTFLLNRLDQMAVRIEASTGEYESYDTKQILMQMIGELLDDQVSNRAAKKLMTIHSGIK